MEPPSAAIPFKMLLSSALFIFICILERSSSLGKAKTHTGAESCPLSLSFLNRPCADYGAISVYHLLSSDDEIFIQNFSHVFLCARCCKLQERRKEFSIIWQWQRLMKYCQYLCETCIIFFIAASPLLPTHFAIFISSPLKSLNFVSEQKTAILPDRNWL